MRQVVVVVKCDVCSAEVAEAEVEVVQWSLGAAGYELDLGPECAGKLSAMTVGDLAELSRPATQPKPKRTYKPRTSNAKGGAAAPYATADGRWACPLCHSTFARPGGLLTHTQSLHGTHLRDFVKTG